MTEKQKKLVENYIRLQVKKRLNEGQTTDAFDRVLDGLDSALKLARNRKMDTTKFLNVLKYSIKQINTITGIK